MSPIKKQNQVVLVLFFQVITVVGHIWSVCNRAYKHHAIAKSPNIETQNIDQLNLLTQWCRNIFFQVVGLLRFHHCFENHSFGDTSLVKKVFSKRGDRFSNLILKINFIIMKKSLTLILPSNKEVHVRLYALKLTKIKTKEIILRNSKRKTKTKF